MFEVHVERIDLAMYAGRVRLRNPLVIAAGPWSSGAEDLPSLAHAGAIVAKTVTAAAREGNPPPVLCAVPGGHLNRVGLRNPGAHAFAKELLPRILAHGAPVVQSITGQSEAEIEIILEALAPLPLAGYELNASCPNVPGGQLPADTLQTVLRRARKLTRRPLWVKLSYAPSDLLLQRARICADEGADAITAINTLPALHVDRRSGARFSGGLSGPSLTLLAQWAVDLLCREQPLPVIAAGGVAGTEQLLAFLSLGASAVQLGSALLADAGLVERITQGLGAAYAACGARDLAELRAAFSAVPQVAGARP